jgi:DNA-binding NarL/FixJ family response regulator
MNIVIKKNIPPSLFCIAQLLYCGIFKSLSFCMSSLNVLVADHQPIFAEGVKRVLDTPNNIVSCKVSGIVRQGSQISAILREFTSDILLFDPGMPDIDGASLITELKRQYNNLRVLIITDHNDPRLVKASLKAGADGYLLKTTSQDELYTALFEVSEGHTFLGHGVSAATRTSYALESLPLLEDNFARKYNLTKREVEILKYIGQALNNKEIGDRLYISDQTVSVHRKNIMRKLKVNSTASLIRIAYENNLADVAA